MEAVLHVKGLAYCKIEIEDANMPPSFNLIDHIIIHEGMGISIPTLTLYLFDQTGTLQNDLNLVQGTKCSISLARDGETDRIIKRTFSLWGMKRGTTNEGPHLQAVFLLDVPKWSAGVYCENFRTSSSGALAQMASRAGLKYNGPGSTDDTMNWLNINTTRSSFSEDVAMRGFASGTSCMSRVLTADSELRYKDLFKELRAQEKATLLLNMTETGVNPYPVKEMQESTLSGVMAHWFNYGSIQHEHSLNNDGQQVTDTLQAPTFGDAFPISDRIKTLISDSEGARVTYTGFDSGTEPLPHSNLHHKYEQAFYQNLRGLGLFSERARALLTVMSDISSFDCIKYVQRDPVGHQLVPSKSVNGKYLVAGKTMRIKNGHAYSEVLDLIRPYVSNPGESASSGQANTRHMEKANAGDFNLAEEIDAKIAVPEQQTPDLPLPMPSPVSEVEQAQGLMDSLVAYDEVYPAVPAVPQPGAGGMSGTSIGATVQRNLRNSINEINKRTSNLSNAVANSASGFTQESYHTIKRISSSAVKTSANAVINAVERVSRETGYASGIEGLSDTVMQEVATAVDMPVLDRYIARGDAALTQAVDTVVSVVTAQQSAVNDLIGDVQRGGVFIEDFLQKGLDIPQDAVRNVVDAIEQTANLGSNFMFPASKFDITANDVAVGPADIASFLLDYVEGRTNPQQFLREKGIEAYEESFGTMTPGLAKEAIDKLGSSAKEVLDRFGVSEKIIDTYRDVERKVDEAAYDAIDQVTALAPDATIKLPGVDASTMDAQQALEMLSRRSGDTDYSRIMDFFYGESNVAPVLERIISKERHSASSTAEVITTDRIPVSWAEYTRIGSYQAMRENSEELWEFPHTMPYLKQEEGEGKSHNMSSSTGI